MSPNDLAKTLLGLALGILLAACSGVTKTAQVSDPGPPAPTATRTPHIPSVSTRSIPATSTITPSPTHLPAISATLTPWPTFTPYPTTVEEATIEAFGPLCSDTVNGVEISPDGKWIAAACYKDNEKGDSPLRVVSMDRSRDWRIYYRDFVRDDDGGFPDESISYAMDSFIPYRWSKDGRFIYAVAWSRYSGCCWVGAQYMLLVRLNLETGAQTALLNGTGDPDQYHPFSFTMSNSDRYLLFDPPSFFTPNDFIVLDLATWEAQAIKVKYPRAIDMTLAVMSPEEDKIVLPLYEYRGMDVLPHHLLDSIALINLATGKQSLLISGLSEEEALYPVRFVDSDWVLLSSGEPYRSYQMEYWLLNIHSRELKKVDPP